MRRLLTHISNFLIFIFALFLSTACGFELEDGKSTIINETGGISYRLFDRYVDKHGNRGVVVYANQNECIIVLSDDETLAPWGIMGETVMPIDSVRHSFSRTNTRYGIGMFMRMKELGIEKFPAQEWCDNKNCGDEVYMGSWHLPTAGEIMSLTKNGQLENLNKRLNLYRKTPLSTDEAYWTCVEDIKGSSSGLTNIDNVVGDLIYDSDNRAVPLFLPSSIRVSKSNWQKKEKHRVRAIKYIYYRE